MFLNKTGYRYGCPWTCPYGSKDPVVYSEEDYYVTDQILKDSIVFYDPLYPPNETDLMDRYIEAFKKIWNNMDELLAYDLDPADPSLLKG